MYDFLFGIWYFEIESSHMGMRWNVFIGVTKGHVGDMNIYFDIIFVIDVNFYILQLIY